MLNNVRKNLIQRIWYYYWQTEAVANFIKKEILAQVFSCELCKIFKNTFFTEHLQWLLLDWGIHLIPYLLTVYFSLSKDFSHHLIEPTKSIKDRNVEEASNGHKTSDNIPNLGWVIDWSRTHYFKMISLAFPLPAPRWVSDNTDLSLNSNISKTIRVNITITWKLFK